MTKVVFLNRFFFPDHSATSQILSDLAFHLSDEGRSVHVVTSRLRYDDPAAHLPPKEEVAGVSIHRVWTSRNGRASLPGRMLDYASFYVAAMRIAARLLDPGDILVAKTDPPLLSLPAGYLSRTHKARLINWLQDLYPEIAAEMGMKVFAGPLGKILTTARNCAVRRADANVAIGDAMAERLKAAGVSSDKIHVIPNWCDDDLVRPIIRSTLRNAWSLDDKFVIGYSGNLGRAHEIATLLGAAERLRSREDIRFLFIGSGHLTSELEGQVRERGLDSFVFKPYQPREALAESLSVADVHWISLRPGFEGLIVPSKFYGIAAAGRPVIIVSHPEGELARLVKAHQCGVAITVGDEEGLATAIARLADNREQGELMGTNARALLDERFSKAAALKSWMRLIDDLACVSDPARADSDTEPAQRDPAPASLT